MTVHLYRVATTTNSESLAGAIAHRLREGDGVNLQAYGLRQTGIAAKGAAIAREYLLEEGVGLEVAIEQVQIALTPELIKYGVRIGLRARELYDDAIEARP